METHVQLNPAWPTEPIASKQQVLDGITGFVEYWDFSLANTSYESRVTSLAKSHLFVINRLNHLVQSVCLTGCKLNHMAFRRLRMRCVRYY